MSAPFIILVIILHLQTCLCDSGLLLAMWAHGSTRRRVLYLWERLRHPSVPRLALIRSHHWAEGSGLVQECPGAMDTEATVSETCDWKCLLFVVCRWGGSGWEERLKTVLAVDVDPQRILHPSAGGPLCCGEGQEQGRLGKEGNQCCFYLMADWQAKEQQ